MTLFGELVDDAALVGPSATAIDAAAGRHQVLRSRFPSVLHSIVVEDRQLLALDRRAEPGTPVTVLNTSGAGGVTALANRPVGNLRIVAVDAALRDPDDLAGNVARIAAAARELDPAVAVNVVLPQLSGRERIVADIEAEGLYAVVGHGADAAGLGTALSLLVEADLPFSVDAVPTAPALLRLLSMIDALVDGADPAAVAAERRDDADLSATIRGWDADRGGRVRRRLRSIRTTDVAGILQALDRWQLIGTGAG
jgi:hypothetical protein